MKNLEIIKLKVENLRELFKFLLLLIFSLMTGLVTLTFWVLTKKVNIYFIIFVGIGLILLFFVVKATTNLWYYMNKLIGEC